MPKSQNWFESKNNSVETKTEVSSVNARESLITTIEDSLGPLKNLSLAELLDLVKRMDEVSETGRGGQIAWEAINTLIQKNPSLKEEVDKNIFWKLPRATEIYDLANARASLEKGNHKEAMRYMDDLHG